MVADKAEHSILSKVVTHQYQDRYGFFCHNLAPATPLMSQTYPGIKVLAFGKKGFVTDGNKLAKSARCKSCFSLLPPSTITH
jgi:hypothetical protein